MARFISEAASSAHRAHQAGASCAGSLASHRLTSTSLTVRSSGRRPLRGRFPSVAALLTAPLTLFGRSDGIPSIHRVCGPPVLRQSCEG